MTAIDMSTESQLRRICDFYQKNLGIQVDPSVVQIPERPPKENRLIAIPEGLTIRKLLDFLRTQFLVSFETEDLNIERPIKGMNCGIVGVDQENTETYAVWIRGVEDSIKFPEVRFIYDREVHKITVLERLLHESLHYMETGDHVVPEGTWNDIAICNSCKTSGGYMPILRWGDERGFYLTFYDVEGC